MIWCIKSHLSGRPYSNPLQWFTLSSTTYIYYTHLIHICKTKTYIYIYIPNIDIYIASYIYIYTYIYLVYIYIYYQPYFTAIQSIALPSKWLAHITEADLHLPGVSFARECDGQITYAKLGIYHDLLIIYQYNKDTQGHYWYIYIHTYIHTICQVY